MKTKTLKKNEIIKAWYLIDATGVRLGKLATKIASLLIGKHKKLNASYLDGGDNVVVINSLNLDIHPSKVDAKKYYTHSGYPGGIKEKSFKDLKVKDPNSIISIAVKGMLPKNKLLDKRIKHLHIYTDGAHKFEAQKPLKIEIK